ncbi:MAG TPA: dUTP diphosphatase [Candidatus Brachybacterium merdavium]|uniref:dUTP diphosphatase n=1 Tax=Candidatus Brachybacterium merdavium TaxID=2838513 RepID=A0A9D2LFG9_9MICO|nr:dUTP diphosphatase [Candidatus Brachybacterium merdavium]
MPADTSTTTAADSASAQAAPDLRIQVAPGASMPTRAHTDDAGLDLASAEDLEIPPGGRALVDTGLAVALPPGTVGMVCPRSGLAAKHGITVLNGPGIVDAGYRGPVKVALHNTDPIESFALQRGDRIAQLVVVPFLAPVLEQVDELDDTQRADAGFGSSGGFTAGPATRDPAQSKEA